MSIFNFGSLNIDRVYSVDHFVYRSQRLYTPAEKVTPVNTTGAGDTFIGYFFAGLARGNSVKNSMETANRAAAICVTRPGAADSIPQRKELE